MTNKPVVIKYRLKITKLTKKLYLEDEKAYTINLVVVLATELLRGYKATKIQQSNKTGTKINFVKLDGKMFDFEMGKIRERLSKYIN